MVLKLRFSLSLLFMLGLGVTYAYACTPLIYTDAKGNVYYDRTMELTGDLP